MKLIQELEKTTHQSVIEGLENIGIEFLIYLPDSTMKEVLSYFQTKEDVSMIPVAREEEGVGILTGLVACGRRAVMIIQDSGIGNLLNSYVSLAEVYRVPMLIIAAQRGGLGEINRTNGAFGRVASAIVAATGSHPLKLDKATELEMWPDMIESTYRAAATTMRPKVVFINFRNEKK